MSSVKVSPLLAVEHDDARRALQADEEVVLAALVVVEAANDALTGEGDVRLPRRLRQQALAAELREPAALVLEEPQRDAEQAVDHGSLFTPVRAIRAPISGRDSCVPASSHQPLTRWHGERALLRVVAVHVGDLELASRRRRAARG